ncbi:MAG: TetR/AcrR family transcriptional regulator [Anaerolineaceae bacterium]
MVRVVKEHSERRAEILASATKMVYTKGFDQMTIQDILDDLGISKGAFYHYFDSKQALLTAMIDGMTDQAVHVLAPIIEDPRLNAVEKMNRYFAQAANWKVSQKEYFLSLMRIWYKDENLIVRNKVQEAMLGSIGPMIAAIIRQGIAEGLMTTAYPDQAAEIILGMIANLGEYGTSKMVWLDLRMEHIPMIMNVAAAYNDAIERVIGLPPRSVRVVNTEALKDWIVTPAPAGQTS